MSIFHGRTRINKQFISQFNSMIYILIVSLVIGTSIAVAVAVSGAMYVPWDDSAWSQDHLVFGESLWLLSARVSWVGSRDFIRITSTRSNKEQLAWMDQHYSSSAEERPRLWSIEELSSDVQRQLHAELAAARPGDAIIIDRWGWPMRMLAVTQVCRSDGVSPLKFTVRECRGGISLKKHKGKQFQAIYAAIPLRPQWLGLFANSLAWSIPSLAVLLAWQYGRRLRRFREGRCENCGYDLCFSTDRPCPECGTVSANPGVRDRHRQSN